MWRKMDSSRTISKKHGAILEGLLKIKESMIPTSAVNSQIKRKLKKIRIREILDDAKPSAVGVQVLELSP